jgi:hypothetical protein
VGSGHPREEDGEQQRQAGAGGGGEGGGGGVDRRLRVPAQAPGGQPLPGALPGTTLSHSLQGAAGGAQIYPAGSSSVAVSWFFDACIQIHLRPCACASSFTCLVN